MVKRGEVWWANLPEPSGSNPGFRRPVVIIQSNPFNQSHINTVIVAIITSNMRLAQAPGNVFLSKRDTKLHKESVVNVSQLLTVDKRFLTERICMLSAKNIEDIEQGLKLILALQ